MYNLSATNKLQDGGSHSTDLQRREVVSRRRQKRRGFRRNGRPEVMRGVDHARGRLLELALCALGGLRDVRLHHC